MEIILTFPFTARNANVLATTMAALDDSPEPAGTDPVTRKSTGTGASLFPAK
jgi:hypothetical protein